MGRNLFFEKFNHANIHKVKGDLYQFAFKDIIVMQYFFEIIFNPNCIGIIPSNHSFSDSFSMNATWYYRNFVTFYSLNRFSEKSFR